MTTADPTPTPRIPEPATPAAPAVEQPDPGIDELQADRDATRERLAATVEELAAKADVKARAKEQADQTAQQLRATADEVVDRAREVPPAVYLAVAVGVVALTVVLIRRRRRVLG